tara:strand:+ start:1371 stop:3350 length:1980 start_codon:yes stop_codon:yes gene_type:complete
MSQTKAQLISDLVQALNFTGTSSAPANGVYLSAANTISLSTNSTGERLTISSTGKVGIGVASPDSLLHIHNGSAGSIAASSAANLTIESSDSSYNVLQFLSPATAAQQIRFGDPSDNGAGWIQYAHSDNALQFGTAGPEKMRIDSSGRLLVGHTVSIDQHSTIQSFTTGNDTFAGFKYGDNAAPNIIRLGKSRNASIGGNTIVADDDEIGRIGFVGADGSDFQDCAAVQCFVDGAPSNGTDMPGRLVFSTTADTSGSLTSRLTIDSGGFVGIGTTSPRRHFHIHNSASATVGMMLTNGNTGEADDSQGFQLKVGSDSHAEIAQLENSYIQILTNGSNAMRITNAQKVGIGTTTPSHTLHVVNSGYQIIRCENNDNGSDGPYIEMYTNSSSPAVNDYSGVFSFKNRNSAAEEITYSQMRTRVDNVTDGSEAGHISFHTRHAGTFGQRLTITSNGKIHSLNAVQSGGNTTGGFQFDAVDTACVLGIQQPSSASDANAAIQVWDGSSNNLRINYSGLIKTAGGIQFTGQTDSSATGATSGDTTLEHYEEGTWTPVNGSADSITFTVGSASYIRVGDLVFINFYITYPTTSGSALTNISGLPFTAKGGGNYSYFTGRIASLSNGVAVQVNATTSYMHIYVGDVAYVNSQVSGKYVLVSGCYSA